MISIVRPTNASHGRMMKGPTVANEAFMVGHQSSASYVVNEAAGGGGKESTLVAERTRRRDGLIDPLSSSSVRLPSKRSPSGAAGMPTEGRRMMGLAGACWERGCNQWDNFYVKTKDGDSMYHLYRYSRSGT